LNRKKELRDCKKDLAKRSKLNPAGKPEENNKKCSFFKILILKQVGAYTLVRPLVDK
jgi:hypothetical protein